MNQFIMQYDNSLTEFLCDDIIENFQIFTTDNEILFEIPKNNTDWINIEKYLYKELLIKINYYKNSIINFINNNDLIVSLTEKIYTNCFTIYNCKNESINYDTFFKRYNSRYSFLIFLFFINDCEEKDEIIFNESLIIKPKKGSLLLFPDDLNYNIRFNMKQTTMVYGQLYNTYC
jgi:hypothetical protein